MLKNVNKKIIWQVLDVCLILLAAILAFFAIKNISSHYREPAKIIKKSVEKINTEKNLCKDCVARFIDGISVEPGLQNFAPYAVVIENDPAARPPSGLARANLVYEAETEGMITRFLAIYAAGEKIDKIGPIRSARPYFLDWSRGVSATFVHVGGSPEALVKIAKENIPDMNEFYKGKYFWRSDSRKAPHNVYSSSDSINKYLAEKGTEKGNFIPYNFKKELEESKRPDEQNITIGFKLQSFDVSWKYNKSTNSYTRYMGGEIHKDDDGEIVAAKNILIALLPYEVIDSKLRIRMETIGDGHSIACMDGSCKTGKWLKKSSSARIRFLVEEGSEINVNPGTTWIEIISPEIKITY